MKKLSDKCSGSFSNGGMEMDAKSEAEIRFDLLFEKYFKDLVGFACRRLGDYYLAQDMAIETFITAWDKWSDPGLHESPARWLFATLKFIISNEQRKKHYKAEVSLCEHDLSCDDIEVSLTLSFPAGLSDNEREILVWRFKDQLSFAEIAEKLGIEEGAATKRCSRALQHCRDLLNREK